VSTPRFFIHLEGSQQCVLCPSNCVLPPGKGGRCGVRFNREGKAAIPFYGYITALAVDPIEKKPLYHFRPGTEILSLGFTGCNLYCPFCQNWRISQNTDAPGKDYSPKDIIALAGNRIEPTRSIAYTYSEPLIHIEFLLDCMKEARKAGIANVLVSNGCVNADAAEDILDLCDAANIDLKCFSAETYSQVLGGDLAAVTGFIRMAVEKNVHVELTTLLVPNLNDSRAELDKCRDFITELETGSNNKAVIPWHLSAYHPDYKWAGQARYSRTSHSRYAEHDHAFSIPPATTPDSLVAAVKRAREKLPFVYAGNIALPPGEQSFNDTPCPSCGKSLIKRSGYRIDTSDLLRKKEHGKQAYFCASCGKEISFIRGASLI